MPHRPERPAGATASAAPTSNVYNHVAAASAIRGTTVAHILRPTPQAALQSAGVYQPAGVVTPIVNSMNGLTQKPWMESHIRGVHRMAPSLETPESSDSADRSTGTKHDEDCTVATLATEATAEEMEKREDTASALLLVSTQGVRHDSDEGRSSNVPLKKRKRHLDFLRRNQMVGTDFDKETDPCHVSPLHVEGRTVSSEEVTPGRPSQVIATGAQHSNSYDSKESPYQQATKKSTQALLDSSKIHSTTDIAPSSHVVVPHFPSGLHQVLSDPEYAGTVIQWLPDGEAWKVLRWDSLRRQVLPRYFADLEDENGKGCGTIDAFLWHLTAWGFKEVKDGTDVGAYSHDLFIRGAQKLCSKMRFTAVPSDEDQHANGPNTVSPARVRNGGADRSMLQVPSLASMSRSDAESESLKRNPPKKRARYDAQSSVDIPKSSVNRQTSPGPLNWPARPAQDSSMLRGYRPEDTYSESAGWGPYYSNNIGMRQMAGQYQGSNYDPRFHLRQVGAEPVMRHPQHPASYGPQVRSCRGSLRLPTSNRANSTSSPVTAPAIRSSFPVSNRGKGPRRPSACRSAIPTGDVAKSAKIGERGFSAETSFSLGEAQRIGSAVHGVAVAVSRKTKRKLPLARKSEVVAMNAFENKN